MEMRSRKAWGVAPDVAGAGGAALLGGGGVCQRRGKHDTPVAQRVRPAGHQEGLPGLAQRQPPAARRAVACARAVHRVSSEVRGVPGWQLDRPCLRAVHQQIYLSLCLQLVAGLQ